MRTSRVIVATALVLMLLAMTAGPALGKATKVHDAIWVDGDLYGVVLTPAHFKNGGAMHALDIIYNFDGSGLSGQKSIAEVAQGTPGYNGGRWHVYAVTFTELGLSIHDPDDDGVVNFQLMSAEQVLAHMALGHLTISPTDIYFECPLIPQH